MRKEELERLAKQLEPLKGLPDKIRRGDFTNITFIVNKPKTSMKN